MSSINVDTIKSRTGGPPTLSKGVVVSSAATFSSDVSIGGTLTYEDVTNVDAVGLITARSGIKFGAAGIGGTIAANGNTTLAGVVTATSFSGDGSSLTGLANTDFINATQLNVIGFTTVKSLNQFDYLAAKGVAAGGATGVAATVSIGVTVAPKSPANRYYLQGSANGYYLEGEEAPFYNLTPGRTYRFNQNDSSNNNHPIILYFEADKTTEYTSNVVYYADGVKASASAYNSAFNAASVRYTEIEISDTTPNVLHYQCYNHGLMGNAAQLNAGVLVQTGIATVTGLSVSGIATLSGNLQVGSGVTIGPAGVATFSGTADVHLLDNVRLNVGDGSDLAVYHDGSNSYIKHEGTGSLILNAADTGEDIYVRAADDVFIQTQTSEYSIKAFGNGAVELYYNNSKKFETTNDGTITTGIHTVTVGTDLLGYKVEEGSTAATSLNGEFDYELENGHVQRYSAATGGNYFPDFRVSSSQSLSSVMDVGDVVTATLIVASSSHYCTTGVKIDNSTSNIDLDWVGGSAPSAANGSGFDVYSFTIMKTAATPAYHIIGNASGVA